MPREPIPTPDRLDRAVYLDFESFQNADTPTLAGVVIDGVFTQTVFDPAFTSAAEESGMLVEAARVWATALLDRCRREDRVIVAFSAHEAHWLRRLTFDDADFDYFDALRLARRWRSRLHPHATPRRRRRPARQFAPRIGNRLLDFAVLAGIRVIPRYGAGRTTARLRHVRDQLAARGAFDALTPTAQRKWRDTLAHNRWDCEAMAELVRIATDGIAASAPRPIQKGDPAQLAFAFAG